jgi:hypothetical protein
MAPAVLQGPHVHTTHVDLAAHLMSCTTSAATGPGLLILTADMDEHTLGRTTVRLQEIQLFASGVGCQAVKPVR